MYIVNEINTIKYVYLFFFFLIDAHKNYRDKAEHHKTTVCTNIVTVVG